MNDVPAQEDGISITVSYEEAVTLGTILRREWHRLSKLKTVPRGMSMGEATETIRVAEQLANLLEVEIEALMPPEIGPNL